MMDPVQTRQYAPYLAPVVIIALGWALFVRPLANENASVAGELETLRRRIDTVRAQTGALPPPTPAGDPLAAFERQVSVGDSSGRLLEELSRLAARTGLRVDTIETADEAAAAFGAAPGASSAATLDPRLSLFQSPLKYSPVTLSADTDYASLGTFLWQLRELPTIVEVRSLDVRAPVVGGNQEPVAPGTLHVVLTLFAYSREPGAAGGGQGAGT